MKAVVLAAGKSKRLKGFKQGLPKVLLPVGSQTILERNLRYLKKFGFRDIVINVHYRADLIRRFLQQSGNFGLRLNLSYEKDLRGTAGGVKKVHAKLGKKPFLVLYGDNLTDFNLRGMVKAYERTKPAVLLGVYDPRKTKWSGIAAGLIRTDEGGRITRFEERRNNRKVQKAVWVNAGVMILSPEILKLIPSDRIYDFSRDLFPKLLQQNKIIRIFFGASYVMASDTVEAWEKTNRLLSRRKTN